MHHSRSAITFHDSKRIDDDRGLCETPGCQNRQEISNIRLCRDCVTKKNRCKREEDEESEAKDCYCQPCYHKQHRKTGHLVDPTVKHYVPRFGLYQQRTAGLCQRHYRNRHLESSAATASAATATNERFRTKAMGGRRQKETGGSE